jgi:two-component sensor histidine kinase/heme exporter protein D
MGSNAASGRFSAPLKLHVFFVAAAVSLPMVALAALLLHNLTNTTRRLHEQTARVFARQLAKDVENNLQRFIAALEALRTSPSLTSDLPAFHRQAVEVSGRLGTAIVMRDAAGQQLVNTILPYGAELPRSSGESLLEADRKARETEQPAVSGLYRGAVTKQPYLAVVVPILQPGLRGATLNVGLPPQALLAMIAETTPATWTAAVIDATGKIIARSKELDRFLGMSAVTVDVAHPNSERVWLGRTADGERVFGAQVKVAPAGWWVAVGIPESLISEATGTAPANLAMLAALAIAVSLLAALVFSRWLQMPLRRISDLQPGSRLPPFSVREFNDLATHIADGYLRQNDLMREVNHRAKNLLSIILAMARLSVRSPSERAYADQLAHRIAGIASVHDLLVASGWNGVKLEDLVVCQIEANGVPACTAGDDVVVSSAAAQTLGLALNELAAEAAQRTRSDSVKRQAEVSWSAAGGRFRLEWVELAEGPVASELPPFARRLLIQAVQDALEAVVDYRVDGTVVRWTCEAPLVKVEHALGVEPD